MREEETTFERAAPFGPAKKPGGKVDEHRNPGRYVANALLPEAEVRRRQGREQRLIQLVVTQLSQRERKRRPQKIMLHLRNQSPEGLETVAIDRRDFSSELGRASQ